jgi:hypothetical protein
MDGMLPPVDVGGWADYQRRRAQQFARERIAQAGAIAGQGGDWAARAGQSLNGLIPDWAQQPAEPPRLPQLTPPSLPSLPSLSEATQDWAARATDRIGQLGGDLGGVIDQAQGIIGPAASAVGQVISQPDAPDPWGPRTPGVPNFSEWAGEGLRGQGQTMLDTAQRDADLTGLGGLPGMVGARQAAGSAVLGLGNAFGKAAEGVAKANTGIPRRYGGTSDDDGVASGTVAGGVWEGAEALNPYALQGTAVHGALKGAGAPDWLANPAGLAVEAAAPNTLIDDVVELAAKRGWRFARPLVAKAVEAVGADEAVRLLRETPDRLVEAVRTVADRYGFQPEIGMGVRAGGPPIGPSAPGAGMTPEQIQQRVRQAEDALYTWHGEATPEYDYVARLLRPAADGTPSRWAQMVETGRLDPDALNRALIGYREEGLSEADALSRALGGPEARAANLEIGEAAGGVRDPSGVTKGVLKQAINDLAEDGRPFVTTSERGAFKAGRNEPPNPAGKKNAWEYVDKNGRSQWLSTPYEVLFAKQLDANPDVAYWMQSSPEAVMETTVRHGGTPKVFTPDFIVVGTDGRIQVVEIKNIGAYRQVTWRVPEKLREAEEFFNSKGVGFSIFVEDQLGRVAAGKAQPEDFLPDANGRSGVVNGFFVESEEGSKVGRFDPEAARGELAKRLREAGGAWETNEIGYLSGYHPVTQAEYDELLASERWPAWSKRMERGRIGRPDRRPALITPDQRKKIIAAGVGGVHPAEGGYGRPYEGAYPVRPEQGGYDPTWTPHRAYAEFNERQRRKGAPSIAVDAVESYPLMRQRSPAIYEEWGKQVADGQHGMSVDPLNGTFGVPGRYAVSIYPDMGLEFKGKFDQIHPDRLAMFMAEATPILQEVPGSRVGVWYDSSDDITYLDISVGVDSLDQATDLGKRLSQKAIFDSVAKQDIKLRYEGRPLGDVPPSPSRQEQDDAISAFARTAARSQPRGAAVSGASALRGAGARNGAAGAALGGRAGRAAGGVPGAEAPGYAGPDGSRGAGLGSLERGDVGGAPANYPVPVGGATPVPGGTVPGFGAAAGAAGEDGGLSGALQRALSSIQPYGAARTGGERAFDVAAGTAGGIAGAATADEDATWQERAGRFAAGATGASLVGPTLRGGLGLAGRRLTDRSLGVAAGSGAAAASGTPPAPGGLTKLGAATQIAQATPLLSPSSLTWNALGGVARTAQRFLTDSVGNLDKPASSIADLAGMGSALPKAWAEARREFLNLSPQGATAQGVSAGGLSDSKKLWAQLLTGGTRANAATDRFFRTLNEEGAGTRALSRGRSSAEAMEAATRAGDFSSFLGKNSPIADALVGAGRWANDRSLPMPRRLFGAAVAGFAPYVRTPERILYSTIKLGTDPLTQPVAFLRALKRGDETAMRDAGGRFVVASSLAAWFANEYFSGALRGDPPSNPTERRKAEADGAQWNTWRGVPLGRIGPVGGAASGVATALAAGERAVLRGEHPADLGRDVVNAMGKWVLSNSYLDDLQQFSEDVASGRLAQAAEKQAVNTGTRALSPLTSAIGAFDPSERTREGTGEELLYKLPGGRFALPERLDPTTGEPVRRKGNAFTRYAGFAQGRETSPEGEELARFGVNAPEYRAGEAYQGAPLTGAQARIVQRASGSEINRATREALASPEYKAADEAGKEKLLRAALARARERADIVAGEQVSRGTKQQAQREYDAIPRYRGVSGTPDEIRTKNDEIARAKSALSAARSKGRQAEADWIKAHPDLYTLARRDGVDADRLKYQREKIEQKYGVELG